MSASVTPILRMARVSKTYEVASPHRGGPARALDAVANVTLEVQPGEFVAIIGPSGCGKTTVLFLLAGLRPPTEGTIEVCGRPPRQAVRDGLCSLIFQAPVLLEWLSAEENVLLPLRLRDPRWWLWPWARRRYRPQAEQLLQTVQLEEFAHYRPDALSGGMQQRVALARALTLNPQVLLLDEPFGALDEITRDRMNLELLRLVEQRRLTAVFVTHSIEEAVFLADRVVVMGRGASPRTGSSVVCEVEVNLPRPRTPAVKEDPAFFQIVRQGRAALREAQQA
ncbi:MAG: ABC transporter ATP-binding protein [Armatimonadota bacterium]|nr:ABC transporter ATP-binding protein [Armatimonadota bacterium]MDR7438088.1 ABC transporter ATP-binding protein [Armatimonadota bacterium]MDR7471456.1 ABC transporter ATP-binding protein [Armatimonadota bacterium]MDR7507977.1 ABC transporter ATP-binding protein [Armatimonadota bacterium]MDR7510306.1 ABC transporter ATP-binding protein [Armatimonadota bacterium]